MERLTGFSGSRSQPASISVLKKTVATVLCITLTHCMGSTIGFQLDRVGLKSQTWVRWNPA